MIGYKRYRKSLIDLLNDKNYKDNLDYETSFFYWSHIDENMTKGRSRIYNTKRFDKYLSRNNISLSSDSISPPSPIYSFPISGVNNFYNLADHYLMTMSNIDNCKYCYNEAMYLWLGRVIFSHYVLFDGEFRYYYIDYKSIEEILHRDIVIFRNRMRLLGDHCPIRPSSIHILDNYSKEDLGMYQEECRYEIEYTPIDDEKYLSGIYSDKIEEIPLNLEYIDSKVYYVNNLIIKEILRNVQNQEI